MMVSIELLKSWDRERSLVLISGGILAIVSIFGCALMIDLRMIVEKQQSLRPNRPCILEANTGLKVVWGFRAFLDNQPIYTTKDAKENRTQPQTSKTNLTATDAKDAKEGKIKKSKLAEAPRNRAFSH